MFKVWQSQYKVVVDRVDTIEGATNRCERELGPGATLARITYEEELSVIARALTSMKLDYNQELWIGGSPRDDGLVAKWAYCEPGKPKWFMCRVGYTMICNNSHIR